MAHYAKYSGSQDCDVFDFEPGNVPPHRGPYNGVLRLIWAHRTGTRATRWRFGREDRSSHWEEGGVLIFDDAYEHDAWNRTDLRNVRAVC